MSNASNNVVDETLSGKTILAVLRARQSDLTWKAARELLAARRVIVNGTVCQDDARRLNVGDVVEVSNKPRPKPPRHDAICLRYFDDDIAVVEKPSGMLTERPAAEVQPRKKGVPLTPSLDELLPRVINEYAGRRLQGEQREVFIVHR
ncbi:MAG: 23S rRNA pseudouridine synthase, partial [Planctomycetota bacterium]